MNDLTTALEITTCTRCGGNGRYSYCSGYGDTCFKCRGKGTYLTKRGHAAALFLEALRTVPASEIKVGDLIRCESISPYASKSWFAHVTKAEVETESRSKSLKDGVWVDNPPYICVETDHPKNGKHTSYLFPHSKVRKGFSAEVKAEQLKLALAYQATLTKLGKPRKGAVTPA